MNWDGIGTVRPAGEKTTIWLKRMSGRYLPWSNNQQSAITIKPHQSKIKSADTKKYHNFTILLTVHSSWHWALLTCKGGCSWDAIFFSHKVQFCDVSLFQTPCLYWGGKNGTAKVCLCRSTGAILQFWSSFGWKSASGLCLLWAMYLEKQRIVALADRGSIKITKLGPMLCLLSLWYLYCLIQESVNSPLNSLNVEEQQNDCD